MDETKLDGFYIWIARDIERKEIIALHVSKGRSCLEAYLLNGLWRDSLNIF